MRDMTHINRTERCSMPVIRQEKQSACRLVQLAYNASRLAIDRLPSLQAIAAASAVAFDFLKNHRFLVLLGFFKNAHDETMNQK